MLYSNITIYGINSVSFFISYQTSNVNEIFIQKDKLNNPRLKGILNSANINNINVSVVSNIDKIAHIKSNTQGVVAKIKFPIYTNIGELEELSLSNNSLILILDGITDPHNLGACIRSAVAFGVSAIVLPANNSSPINATVVKTSAGTLASSKILLVNNLKAVITQLKEMDYFVLGTGVSSNSDDIQNNISENSKIALIMGSEDKGIKKGIKKLCDTTITIPTSKVVNSLNVSTATAILLSQLSSKLNLI